jgi:hypothetical protein
VSAGPGAPASIAEALAWMGEYEPQVGEPAPPNPPAMSKLLSWVRGDDNPAGAASWPNRVPGQSAFTLQGAGTPLPALIGGQPGLFFDGTCAYLASPLAIPGGLGKRPCVIHIAQLTHVPDDVGAGAFNILGGIGTAGPDIQVADQSVYASMYSSANFLLSQDVAGGAPDFPGAYVFDVKAGALGTPLLLGAQLTFPHVQIFGNEFVAADNVFPPDLATTAPMQTAWVGSTGNAFFADFIGIQGEQLIYDDELSALELAQLCDYAVGRYKGFQP